MVRPNTPPMPIAVLISGTGSNLQALIQGQQQGLPIDIQVVISNRPKAQGLQHADLAGIPTYTIDHRQYSDRASFEAIVTNTLHQYDHQLIVLAGFMRKLTADFVHQFYGKMINLHPALLPKYPGLNTFERALQAGDHEHGSTVHYVSPEVDAGPIISQARLPIQPTDTINTLRQKNTTLEHRLLPHTVRLIAEGRITFNDPNVLLDGKNLPSEGTDLTEII